MNEDGLFTRRDRAHIAVAIVLAIFVVFLLQLHGQEPCVQAAGCAAVSPATAGPAAPFLP